MPRRPVRTVTLALLLGATILGGIAGCATPAATELPDDISVSVYQSRSDASAGLIDVRIVNGSSDPLVLTEATLETTQYAEPTTWSRGTTLRAGATVDLRLELPAPVCPTPADAEPLVTLAFETPEGREGTARVVADDPIGTLAKLSEQDCILFEVGRLALIEPASTLEWTPGDGEPALLDITVTPTGSAGTLEITRANQTVLLALADEAGGVVASVPLDIQVSADSAPVVLPLRFVPNRCDPHAVAEDKRGTFFPLEVLTSGGASGVLYVPVSDEVRGQIYEFVGDYCGFE